MSALDVLASVMLVAGSALALVGAVGLLRLPGVLARMHAATKPVTLGVVLVAVGAALHLRTLPATTELALVVALQLLTAPVGAHLVGRAVYAVDPHAHTALTVDELAADGDDEISVG